MTTRPPRISVVNDNPDFLALMADILDEDAGYDVALFSNDDVTIDEIVGAEPDLLIIDLLLGGVSGWDLVTLARAHDRLAGVPIIVCSADVAELRDRAADLERVGDVHIIAKPFSVDEMTGLVEQLVGRSGAATG
jgi:DNA-binding response OmpR family regulator